LDDGEDAECVAAKIECPCTETLVPVKRSTLVTKVMQSALSKNIDEYHKLPDMLNFDKLILVGATKMVDEDNAIGLIYRFEMYDVYCCIKADKTMYLLRKILLNKEKKKLSKRDQETSQWQLISQLREKGYLPQALVNYLLLLG
jgi:hypothetical protein